MARPDEVAPEAHQTLRQQLVARLRSGPASFEELRRALRLTAKALDDELRHVERSLRGGPDALHVTPAVCAGCGYEFAGREERRFRTPSRCPACRSERIDDAVLHIRE